MSRRVDNLYKRSKKLGLSIYRYYHAFMMGYSDRGQKWKSSPYEQKQLNTAYWEGRKTRYNYDAICRDDIKCKKVLTRLRT
ncbi:hypothetical protein CMI37_12255 [Candidatus Pacearchaeota archaeon]|nr:hypothetical protein [Candidatus Pacearchaeota archaeon]